MNTTSVDRLIRRSQAVALLALPLVWLLMFTLHFHSIADFFVFSAEYVPEPAIDKVTHLIEARNRWPMIHDQHLLGYLSLPLLVLGAFGLYALGRRMRPVMAAPCAWLQASSLSPGRSAAGRARSRDGRAHRRL
jgi:hypothetical protein